MKKFLVLLLTLAMSLSLAACGGDKPADNAGDSTGDTSSSAPADTGSQDAPADSGNTEADYAGMSIDELKPLIQTVSGGKLTVATSPDFAPYEFYAIGEDGTPSLAGFDMALAAYIADFLGLELNPVPIDFDGVLMELSTKSVDLGMAGLSPDPAREGIMDFSDIYYLGGQSFVTVKGSEDKFPDLASTNNPDYQIGAQIGSIQVDLMQENSPDAQQVQLSKVTDIIMELLSGKLDGAYIETAVAESYAVNYPDLAIVLDVPYDVAGSAIGVVKDNPALLAGVNLAIAAAVEDGSMDRFVAEANELAAGTTYEGLLDENGQAKS